MRIQNPAKPLNMELLQKQLTAEATIFTTHSILEVGQGSDHASGTNKPV